MTAGGSPHWSVSLALFSFGFTAAAAGAGCTWGWGSGGGELSRFRCCSFGRSTCFVDFRRVVEEASAADDDAAGIWREGCRDEAEAEGRGGRGNAEREDVLGPTRTLIASGRKKNNPPTRTRGSTGI